MKRWFWFPTRGYKDSVRSATEWTLTYFNYIIKQAANIADIIYRMEDKTC